MKKLLILMLLSPVLTYGQLKTEIRSSMLKFPPNLATWLKRTIKDNNIDISKFGTPGNQIRSNQSKQFYDFNKDGKKDICIELGFEYFRTTAKQDSAKEYYKGIFINKGNETFELDTNYVINGRGYPWYGKFGDFNGDGKVDYFHLIGNYHGDQAKKPLDLYKYRDSPDGSPSHVFLNNGKGFDKVDLDTLNMISNNCQVFDINGDGRDEIISMPSSRFLVYTYNPVTKKFDISLDNINQIIRNKYGNNIKFFTFESIKNSKIKMTISYDFTTSDKNDWKIDIAEIGLKDSTFTVINSFKHPMYQSTSGVLANADIQDNDSYEYTDLNGDGVDELIMISPYSSIPESQGFNIIENNTIKTSKYWTPDLKEVGFRIQGYIKDMNGDGKLDIVSGEWNLDKSYSYFNYYYKFSNGKFNRTQLDLTKNSIKPINIPYWTWANDFNEDGLNDIFVFNNNNIFESYYYKTVDCAKSVKPILNTSKFSFCSSDTLKLSIINSLEKDSYKWYFGSQVDSSNVKSKSFMDSNKLLIIKTDSLGCETKSDTLALTKLAAVPIPSIANSTPLTFCAGQNVVLTSSGANNQWYLNGNAIANATTATFTANASGTYKVKATIGDCSSPLSAASTVVVNSVPDTPKITNSSSLTFCTGQNVVLTSSGTNNQWYLNDAVISNATSTTLTVTASGVYKVKSLNGDCSSPLSAATTVVVNTIPGTPTITATTPLTFCFGQNVVLTSSGTNNQWYLNDNVIANATTATFTANASGTYKVKATNGDCSSPLSAASTVVVNPIPPTPLITQELNGGLTSSATDGNQWYFNEVKIDNATQKTINPTKSGNYTVKVVTPCTSEVSKPFNLVVTATEETILGQVSVSPNPIASEFKISFPVEFGKTAQVKIVDMSGNLQFKKASVIDGEQIDLANLNGGNYILHLNSNDNSNAKAIKISKIH